jgi:putative ABC transport system permease protein
VEGRDVFLALREMRRATSRFLLLGGAVGLLVFVLLFFQSVAGALVGSLTGAVETLRADVLVFGEDADGSIEASLIPTDADDDVRRIDGVEAVAPVGEAAFTVRAGGELTDAALFGVDVDGPGAPTTMDSGRLPQADGEVAASATDDVAGFAIGDTIVLEPGGTRVEVVGTVAEARYSALPTLFATYDTYATAVTDRQGGRGNAPAKLLAVTVADTADDATALADTITREVSGVAAFDQATAVASLPAVGQITQSFAILYGLLYLVVGLVTGVFFLILTVQKRESLVLLRALGSSRRDVVAPLLIQVVVVVGIGVAVGAALTAVSVGAAGQGLGATFEPVDAAVSAGVVLGLALVAATAAVRRVLRIDPVEATMPETL